MAESINRRHIGLVLVLDTIALVLMVISFATDHWNSRISEAQPGDLSKRTLSDDMTHVTVYLNDVIYQGLFSVCVGKRRELLTVQLRTKNKTLYSEEITFLNGTRMKQELGRGPVPTNSRPTQCAPGSFMCPSYNTNGGYCIPQNKVCNKQRDCEFAEDEKNCSKTSEECPWIKDLVCPGTDSEICLDSAERYCDSFNDCGHFEEEQNCTACSNNVTIPCDNGRCVRGKRCNGISECSSGSDEQGCQIDECQNNCPGTCEKLCTGANCTAVRCRKISDTQYTNTKYDKDNKCYFFRWNFEFLFGQAKKDDYIEQKGLHNAYDEFLYHDIIRLSVIAVLSLTMLICLVCVLVTAAAVCGSAKFISTGLVCATIAKFISLLLSLGAYAVYIHYVLNYWHRNMSVQEVCTLNPWLCQVRLLWSFMLGCGACFFLLLGIIAGLVFLCKKTKDKSNEYAMVQTDQR